VKVSNRSVIGSSGVDWTNTVGLAVAFGILEIKGTLQT